MWEGALVATAQGYWATPPGLGQEVEQSFPKGDAGAGVSVGPGTSLQVGMAAAPPAAQVTCLPVSPRAGCAVRAVEVYTAHLLQGGCSLRARTTAAVRGQGGGWASGTRAGPLPTRALPLAGLGARGPSRLGSARGARDPPGRLSFRGRAAGLKGPPYSLSSPSPPSPCAERGHHQVGPCRPWESRGQMKELRGNLYAFSFRANGPMSRDVSFGKPGMRAKAGGRGGTRGRGGVWEGRSPLLRTPPGRLAGLRESRRGIFDTSVGFGPCNVSFKV